MRAALSLAGRGLGQVWPSDYARDTVVFDTTTGGNVDWGELTRQLGKAIEFEPYGHGFVDALLRRWQSTQAA